MPAPRALPASRLLPAGLSEADYIGRFLKAFGAAPGKPKIFTDKIGENLVIGADLFTTASGGSKVLWRGRFRHLRLLAETIKEPDEIWWQWEEFPKGQMTLLRRTIARFEIAGQATSAFALFDVGKEGWRGVTAFAPDRVSYLENQRGGTLAYRRPE